MTVLIPVPCSEVHSVWEVVRPVLEPAIKRAAGIFTAETVLSALLDRDMQLWTAWGSDGLEAAAVTEIRTFPAAKVCAIPLIGGKNRNNWLQFEPQFAEWARANGCTALEGYARPGWLRVLNGGWRHMWTVIRRDL